MNEVTDAEKDLLGKVSAAGDELINIGMTSICH